MTNGNDSISSIPMKRVGETAYRPALPREVNSEYIHVSTGLTKREFFAAMALQGLLANASITSLEYSNNYSSHSVDAVIHADALIEALNKIKNNE